MKGFKTILAAGMMTAAAGLLSQQALAATDGALGANSTGNAALSLSISQLYKVSGLTDLALGAYGGTGDLNANSDLCVYTNDTTAAYHVVVTDTSPTAFVVSNGSNNIPYTVKWNSGTGTTGSTAVTYNTALAGTGANTASTSCAGGKNADIQVSLLAANLAAAPAGSYSTTLSVEIEP